MIGETPSTSETTVGGSVRLTDLQTFWSLSDRKIQLAYCIWCRKVCYFRGEDLTYHCLRDFFVGPIHVHLVLGTYLSSLVYLRTISLLSVFGFDIFQVGPSQMFLSPEVICLISAAMPLEKEKQIELGISACCRVPTVEISGVV